ncbi:MAG: hypothetical protein HOV81_17930 [Kofleriaceae bacterium]|nr:hypothetical protein [Kofleriaceae bacterium]
MRSWFLLALLFACGPTGRVTVSAGLDRHAAEPVTATAPDAYRGCTLDLDGAAPTSADLDALIATVLARFVESPSSLRGYNGLPGRGPVYVAAEIDAHTRVTGSALPRVAARPLVPVSTAQLQKLADLRRMPFAYVRIHEAEILGNCALVQVEATIMSPTSLEEHYCACHPVDVYERREGAWHFSGSRDKMCVVR